MVKKRIKLWFYQFIIALLIIILIKIFLFDIYINSDHRMNSTYSNGDVLLIYKITPGPRLPITLLTIPFTHQYIPFTKSKSYLDFIQLPYVRINIKSIKHNDILLFNYPIEQDKPIDKKTQRISRCVALPGDTFTIYNKEIFVNRKLLECPSTVNFNYRIVLRKNDTTIFRKFNIREYYKLSEKGYDCFIPIYLSKVLDTCSEIKSISLFSTQYKKRDNKYISLFPHSPYNSSSFDFYETIVIPKKNQTVKLNKYNIYLYRKIIELYEKNNLEIVNDTIFIINDTISTYYTFKYNYYFVLDDNRDRSNDSRRWGFLPETHIIGKVIGKVFNIYTLF
ncbi:MAG: signal peptidase I [Bacteroidales bacterium]|nr:signal peptidase I [Bacteroidales bacterium]